jgi:hypothetical protein
MNKDDAIIIERTANGYQVRQLDHSNMICIKDIMVFQDMGFASSMRDYQDSEDTLLGFIEKHFTQKASK